MDTSTRKKSLDVVTNEGVIFDNGDGTWSGAVKIGEEYFEINMTSKMDGDKEMFDLSGTSESDGLEARAPIERRPPSQGKSGSPRPELVGMVRTRNGNVEKELAGWTRTSKSGGKPFFSCKVSDPK